MTRTSSSILTPPQWNLIARDAFNGVMLWTRPVQDWGNRAWMGEGWARDGSSHSGHGPWISNPRVIHKRLVTACTDVYATLGFNSPVTAIDAATGTPSRVGELPRGSLIYADKRFYCLTERGTIMLQEMTQEGFRSTGSFQLARQKDVWAHPVICHGRLYLRYHDTLFCYDVRR